MGKLKTFKLSFLLSLFELAQHFTFLLMVILNLAPQTICQLLDVIK